MERFPSFSTRPTHFVHSEKGQVAVWKNFYNKPVKENSIQVLGYVKNGTKFYVYDEGLGYKNKWVKVRGSLGFHSGKPLYIHKKFLKPLSDTPKSAEYEFDTKTQGNRKVPPIIDWTSLEPNVSYFDKHDAKYKVCVELEEFTSTGGPDISNRLKKACRRGLEIILADNGKRVDDEYITKLMNDVEQRKVFIFCEAEEYFIDPRPNTYLKVLVTLSRKYLLPLEQSTDTAVIDNYLNNVRWDILEKVVFKSSFKTNKLVETLEKASKVVSTYAKHIAKFNGTVNDYDAEAEAENIINLLFPIENLFQTNELKPNPFEKDEIIEFGWDSTLTLIYASLIREDGRTITFSKGMKELSSSVPFDNQRTQGYFWNLTEISKIDAEKYPWTDFLISYTLPEPPVISPSKDKDAPTTHQKIGDISSTDESKAKKEAQVYDENPVKTYDDKIKEDRDVSSLEKKFVLYEDREQAYDFVGDYVSSCYGVEKTLKKINTVDDAFDMVLDKINIAELIGRCMNEITSGLSGLPDLSPDIKKDIGDVGSGVGIGDYTDVSLDYKNDYQDVLTTTTPEIIIKDDIAEVSSEFSKELVEAPDQATKKVTIIKLVKDYYGITDVTPVQDIIEELLKEIGDIKDQNIVADKIISFTDSITDKLISNQLIDPQFPSSIKPEVKDIDLTLTKSIDDAQDKIKELSDFPVQPSEFIDSFNQGDSPRLPPSLQLSFPDSLPTQDVMSSMADDIEFALTTLLNELFVAMTKNVLKNLSDSCNNSDDIEDYGQGNLNDMLEESIPAPMSGQMGKPEALGTLMNSLGIDSGNPQGLSKPDPNRLGQLEEMLDGVSLILTTIELCALINGNASTKVLNLVRTYVVKTYPNIGMTKKSQIIRFFKALGSIIDPSLCLVLESPSPAAPNYTVGDILCRADTEDADDAKKTLYKIKGDGITPEQMAAQVKRARERKAAAAKILADFVNDGPLSDGFSPPPVFCQKGGDSLNTPSPEYNSLNANKKQQGLVDFSHESIDFMTDKAVDLMYDPVYISFSSDISSYPSAFVKAPDASNTEAFSPDSPLAISYFGSKTAAEEAKQPQGEDEGEVKIPTGKPKIMPSLQSTLLNMETNNNVFGEVKILNDVDEIPEGYADYTLGSYGATIPLPTDVVDFSSLKMMNNASDEIIEAIKKIEEQTSSVSWTFNYAEPFVNRSIDLLSEQIPYDVFLVESKGDTNTVVYKQGSTEKFNERLVATLEKDVYKYNKKDDSNIGVNIRKHKFASLLTNRISSLANNKFIPDDFYEDSEGFYDIISSDVIAYVSNIIAASPFFKTIKLEGMDVTDAEGVTHASPTVHKPIIEYLNLDPDPTGEQRLDDCDPHLLNLNELKKQLKEDMKKERCVDLSAPTDGSPSDSLSDQEKEMMKLCVKTIVRTYMIDFYMRSIFSNSVFAPSDEPDALYLEAVKNFIIQDLESYDEPNYIIKNGQSVAVTKKGTYTEEFLEAVVEVADVEGEFDTNALQSQLEVHSPPDLSILTDIAIRSLIKEQYRDVHTTLRSRINSLMISDIESRFVLDYLPIVNYNNFYNKSNERDYKSTVKEFQNTENVGKQVPWNQDSKVDWERGNLFLEPYYYVEYHDKKPKWWDDIDWNYAEPVQFDLNTDSPSQWSYRGVVNREELDNIIQTMSIETGLPLLDFDNPENGMLKSISRGYRLMWAPERSGELEKVKFTKRPSAPDRDDVWKAMWDNLASDNKKFSLDRVAIEKCLINFEIIDEFETNENDSTMNDYIYSYRTVSTFPIIDSRAPVTKEEYSTLILDVLEGEDSPEKHFYLLSEHEDFRSFVDFMFPIKRYKTIMEIFCQQATSYDTMINGAMSATKDDLRRLFFAINSKGDYKQRDPALDAIGGQAGLEKMMKNEFGVQDTPAHPNSWNFNLPLGWGKSVKGLGFEDVAKATGKAVLKIFKRQAEKSDPNISVAYKLAMASKLVNLNIPTSAWSFMLLPANVFPTMPGPPIGPLGWIYHAMGLGLWLRMDGEGGDEQEESALKNEGFGSEVTCQNIGYDEMYNAITQKTIKVGGQAAPLTTADLTPLI